MQKSSATLLLAALLGAPSGCALAPCGAASGTCGGGSVTEDVLGYFQREWPLAEGAACGPDSDPYGDTAGNAVSDATGYGPPALTLGAPDQAPLLRRPAAVSEFPGPPGRFFPAPTKPPFSAPRGMVPANY
ncbi:hypothetical protein [Botrimarina hoheduenensis]|uniref:Uncharacterized protein n=1 Tax=Botrimarina hoheduenensis TaxID=2528000 RepID=A0A5C5WFB2_9BACT|nr:hypothetical protein [Botrimarina hoheduenensis]TWT48452.1 hypothetical protein Pla111_02200 [Botrimarina hoheduenensis]